MRDQWERRSGRAHTERMALGLEIQLIVKINGLAGGWSQGKAWGWRLPENEWDGVWHSFCTLRGSITEQGPGWLEFRGVVQGGKPAVRIWGDRENWGYNENRHHMYSLPTHQTWILVLALLLTRGCVTLSKSLFACEPLFLHL